MDRDILAETEIKGARGGVRDKSTKDKITKSFGELIMDYRKSGYSTRESIENAYKNMYMKETKPKNMTNKTKKKKDEIIDDDL